MFLLSGFPLLKTASVTPNGHRIKSQNSTQHGIQGPAQLGSLISFHSTQYIQGLLFCTSVTLWILVLSSKKFSSLSTDTHHICRQTLPTFQLSSKVLPPKGNFTPSPLALLVCPTTSSLYRPLLQPVIINLKCPCISLSLNCELAESMDATKLFTFLTQCLTVFSTQCLVNTQ